MRVRTWFVLGATAAALSAAVLLVPPRWIVAADAALQPLRPWLGGLRVAGIVSAWVWWNRLTGALPGLPAEAAAYLRERRHFWCGTLAAVELIVVRNAPGALWRLLA